jgi:hypothetical protein
MYRHTRRSAPYTYLTVYRYTRRCVVYTYLTVYRYTMQCVPYTYSLCTGTLCGLCPTSTNCLTVHYAVCALMAQCCLQVLSVYRYTERCVPYTY